MLRFLFFCVMAVSIELNAIELVDKTKIIQKDKAGNEISENGKPIYKALDDITKEPMENITIEPMQVPIIYAEGDKPKLQEPKQEVQKTQPIDKTKHFVDKNELKEQEVKQEKIKLDEGKAFFETLNKKDQKPIDIEK